MIVLYCPRRLVTRGGTLWSLSTQDGSSSPLGIGGRNTLYPAVSLQNHLLAFTRWTLNTNVWRVELGSSPGGHSEQVEARPEVMLISSERRQDGPQFSPDGRHIAFASDRTGSIEIWKSDREGNNPVQLTSLGGALAGNPRWSPDGEWIAFDSWHEDNANIYVVGAQGGPLRAVTTEESEDVVPSWSHDAEWIYFASDRSGDQQIWKIPVAAGGTPMQVTRSGGFEAFESFEGDVIYYSRPNRELGLWQVRPDGSGERPVPGLSQAGSWRYWAVAREGVYFVPGAFRTEAASSPQPVRLFSFRTGKTRTVAKISKKLVEGAAGLAVSPDGRWLLYAQVDRDDRDIMLVEGFQ